MIGLVMNVWLAGAEYARSHSTFCWPDRRKKSQEPLWPFCG